VSRKQVAREGNSGKGPVPLHRAGSDLEDLRDLLDREAGELAQLDDAGLAGTLSRETGECFVDGDNVVDPLRRDGELVVHFDAAEASGASLGVVLAGVVNQDLTHDVGSKADEVGATVPVDALTGEAEVGLVDDRGGLEGMVGALAAHVSLGEAMQLRVNQRQQTACGGGVAVVHGFQELGDFTRIGLRGTPPPMTA